MRQIAAGQADPCERRMSEPRQALTVRAANEADMRAVRDIYAHYVLHSLATFEETAPTLDEMLIAPPRVCRSRPALSGRRDERGNPRLRLCGALSPASGLSLHCRGFGLCRRLASRGQRQRLGAARRTDRTLRGRPWRQMVAVVGDSANFGSIALHRRFGFELAGTLRSVGFKFGRSVDTPILQRALGAARP